MTRLEALENFKAAVSGFEKYLQGGYQHKEKRSHEVDISCHDSDNPHVIGLVEACDSMEEWIRHEIKEEVIKEYDAMPVESNPGYEVGQ